MGTLLREVGDKKPIHALIIQGHKNNMPPMTSNHGGNVIYREATTVYKKGFQMPPLSLSARIRVVYTIPLKYGIIRQFKTTFRQFG